MAVISGGRTFVRRPIEPGGRDDAPFRPYVSDIWFASDQERGQVPTWVEPAGCPPHPHDAGGPSAVARRDGPGGEGVSVAVIERSWDGHRAGDPPEWVEHGERTFGTLHDRSPGCTIGRVSSIYPHTRREQIPEAIVAAIDQLVLRGAGPKVLLIELQTFLSVDQVAGAPVDFARAPGGRFAAGPVDADPLVAELLNAAFAKGILVIVPAGNGGLDLGRCRTADRETPLGSAHASLRVGAVDPRGHTLRSSNHGAGVDVYGPGIGVHTRRNQSWGGTSAAAAAVAAWAVTRWSAQPTLTAAEIRQEVIRNGAFLT